MIHYQFKRYSINALFYVRTRGNSPFNIYDIIDFSCSQEFYTVSVDLSLGSDERPHEHRRFLVITTLVI